MLGEPPELRDSFPEVLSWALGMSWSSPAPAERQGCWQRSYGCKDPMLAAQGEPSVLQGTVWVGGPRLRSGQGQQLRLGGTSLSKEGQFHCRASWVLPASWS